MRTGLRMRSACIPILRLSIVRSILSNDCLITRQAPTDCGAGATLQHSYAELTPFEAERAYRPRMHAFASPSTLPSIIVALVATALTMCSAVPVDVPDVVPVHASAPPTSPTPPTPIGTPVLDTMVYQARCDPTPMMNSTPVTFDRTRLYCTYMHDPCCAGTQWGCNHVPDLRRDYSCR